MSYPVNDPATVAHTEAIGDLPWKTRAIVLDALRVRAMDFVHERLWDNCGEGEVAADVISNFGMGSDPNVFDPDSYTGLPAESNH